MENKQLWKHATWALLWVMIASVRPWAEEPPAVALQNPPLSVDEVVRNLQEKNRERAEALHQLQGSRVYRMQYRGFLGSRDAEMVVTMTYQSPMTKEFKIVSQTGSKFIADKVFKRLLESEQEAMSDENRRKTALSAENYDFTLDSYEVTPEGARYVLNTVPKSNEKFLYRGKIWVDGKDFAVVKIEAQPAKNPSFWIKKTEIEHRYTKVGNFWLPAENRTESYVRLGGKAQLSIEYGDYKIREAAPLQGVERAQENSGRVLNIEPTKP